MSAGAHPDHPDHAPARIAEFVDAWRGKTGADDETPILSAHSGHRQWSHLTLGDLRSLLRENATLRRQLEAAEAQPCDHNSDAFEALERLHGRIHRDFNFDAGECAPPTEDEIALRMMDDLVTFADEVYLPLADATRVAPRRGPGDDETDKYPPHTVTVTHLPPGFDHQDRREHEYVVGNDIVGWTSHQVEHPDACHRLPYGRHCWLDENWYEGPYRYDEIEPGRYQATRVSEMVGDHNGEFSHMDEYVHYERTGDAPGQDAEPGPLESAVTEALADIAATPADPEPAPPAPPWLVPAGDD